MTKLKRMGISPESGVKSLMFAALYPTDQTDQILSEQSGFLFFFFIILQLIVQAVIKYKLPEIAAHAQLGNDPTCGSGQFSLLIN